MPELDDYGQGYVEGQTHIMELALPTLREAHRYFRNRPGNVEVQLCEMIGSTIALIEEQMKGR